MLKLAISGAAGRMGARLIDLGNQNDNFQIVDAVDIFKSWTPSTQQITQNWDKILAQCQALARSMFHWPRLTRTPLRQ